MAIEKKRVTSLDLIRLFSCLCVTLVHFNAQISGYNPETLFTYPNSIIPNFYWEGRIYLGSIGVSLFFMLSGSTLMLTYKPGNIFAYYKKKIKNIFPMFWIAFAAATIFDFFYNKAMPADNPLFLLLSITGLDGYLFTLGWIPFAFYKVGEWFLGCILILYLLFPFLHLCVEKKPFFTTLISLILYWFLTTLGVDSKVFLMRIPEVLLGMLFIKYDMEEKPLTIVAATSGVFLAAWFLRNHIDANTLCIAFCSTLFAIIAASSKLIKSEKVKKCFADFAALTYPIFLVHHWIIQKMVQGFYLPALPKRSVIMMLIVYFAITLIAAKLLMLANQWIIKKLLHRHM